jgi:hypothetical protein
LYILPQNTNLGAYVGGQLLGHLLENLSSAKNSLPYLKTITTSVLVRLEDPPQLLMEVTIRRALQKKNERSGADCGGCYMPWIVIYHSVITSPFSFWILSVLIFFILLTMMHGKRENFFRLKSYIICILSILLLLDRRSAARDPDFLDISCLQ